MTAWLTAIAAGALPAAARVDPLTCPPGSHATAAALPQQNMRAEWCVDASGVREGPFRYLNAADGGIAWQGTYRRGRKHGLVHYYDEQGRMQLEIGYEDDREVSRRFTLDGIRGALQKRNEKARREGSTARVTALDEHTLLFERVDQDAALVRANTDRLRHALASQAELCPLFRLPGTQFERIRVRYTTARGEVVFETVFNPEDCR